MGHGKPGPDGQPVNLSSIQAKSDRHHSTWLLQVAKELGPNARVDGFDISLALCPPQKSLPSNVTISEWDVFNPLPEGTEGQYDLVHVRFLFAALPKSTDIGVLMQKFMKMLSKLPP